ncbi:MAG: hypothetical protein HMLIMOIP_000409 [Candidatus Nitrosomirales archaeon]|jgi:hypothetical protein
MSDDHSEKMIIEDSEKPRKTRSVTFRIDSSVVDDLQKEADGKEVSLNVLANQVLKRFAEWGRYENKLDMMPVPKMMLTSLIDEAVTLAKKGGIKDIDPYRNEIIKHAARLAFNILKDSVLYMKKNYNLWVVLSVLQEYMKVSGINADHVIEGRKHIFIIQHELGENWSLFTQELLKLIFEELAKVRIETSITAKTTKAEVIL